MDPRVTENIKHLLPEQLAANVLKKEQRIMSFTDSNTVEQMIIDAVESVGRTAAVSPERIL